MRKNGPGSYQIDLKETLHLSHQQLPIGEVDEMELVPQIEISERGNEIEISGCLYLHGTYKGNQKERKLDTEEDLPESYEESVQFEPLYTDRGPFSPLAQHDTLESRIPVMIILPKDRVRDTEDIFAYIQSFDYEIKSPYQMELVATLVISGFSEEEDVQRPESKENNVLPDQFEFVHIAKRDEEYSRQDEFESQEFDQRLQAMEKQVGRLEQEQEAMEQDENMVDAANHAAEVDRFEEEKQRVQEEAEDEPGIQAHGQAEGLLEKETRPGEWNPESAAEPIPNNVVPLPGLKEEDLPADGDERPDQQDDAEDPVLHAEEDVKVAISEKGTKQDREPIPSLSSLFARMAGKPPIEQESKEKEPVKEAQSRGQEVSIEKNEQALYLTNFMEDKGEQFTKLRICIVQRDETIEDIAERYKINVETILRANQTGRNQLGAGQVLYIPAKG